MVFPLRDCLAQRSALVLSCQRPSSLLGLANLGGLQPPAAGPYLIATRQDAPPLTLNSVCRIFVPIAPSLHDQSDMASAEELQFTAPHSPTAHALEAFGEVLHITKAEILKSRSHWDKHEPRMWSRAAGIADHDLVHFDLHKDLVQVRSAPTAYGTIILGKIRLPAVNDERGEGFVHARIHHSSEKAVEFHSIWTNEIRVNGEDQPSGWEAVQVADTPLEFFNE